jgi:hypothetical protein
LTRAYFCALAGWTNSGERGEDVAEDLIEALGVAGKAGLRRRQLPNGRQRDCRSLFG